MTGPTQTIPILTPQTLYEIDLYLESIYPNSKKTGEQLADVELKNTQIRGLENIVTSTSRFSEILNFIKNQAGKEKKRQWMTVAPSLLDQLNILEKQAHQMSGADSAVCLEIKMRLARGWAKQVVTHYLYSTKLRKDERS